MSDDIDRRIESLRPEAQKVCRLGLHIIRDDLGIDLIVTETLRSKERQAKLAGGGKSDVTLGWHNVGLAWDTLILVGGVVQHDDRDGLYTVAGHIWQALGCKWPIHIKSGTDWGHAEFHPGFTLQQFLDGKKGGLVT